MVLFGVSWLSWRLFRYEYPDNPPKRSGTLRSQYLDRVQCSAVVHVELKLRSPWRDGTTHPVMTLEFIQEGGPQVPIRRGLPLILARDVRASDWYLPTNSDHRMSQKGREATIAGSSPTGRWRPLPIGDSMENRKFKAARPTRLSPN